MLQMEKQLKPILRVLVICFVAVIFCLLVFWRSPQCGQGDKAGLLSEKERRLKVRRAAVAGMFYESSPRRLEDEITKYLKNANPEPVAGEVIALISPHAGYVYSGQAAAFGFKLLDKDKVNRAIILAPSHWVAFRGVSIPDVSSYETPLGLVDLDRESCDVLLEEELFGSMPEVHSREHALEVQLPFLQVCLGDAFTMVPMVVGQLQEGDYKVIANSLSKVVRKGDVIVVSSDFTHQGPRFGFVPYKTDVKENVKKLDMGAVDYILQKDCGKFVGYVKDTGATICGRCPIGILLELLPNDAKGKLLSYYTSGDVTGDERNTVSYVSLVFSSRSGWPNNQ
jgi:AmmeMemoRadiSam system protein B